ncbi:MAG: hypothetical protein ACLP05_13365 [Candidatus Kryptoniota bacterium]
MTVEFVAWIIFFFFVYRIIRTLIRVSVNKGIRDYEARKESERRKEKEIKIDSEKIEDAKFKDL